MEFLKTDKAWFGFLFAAIVPLIGYVFFYELNEYARTHTIMFYGGLFSKKFIYILAIFCNILPFLVAKRQRLDHQMQGIVGATLVYSILLLMYIVKVYGS